MLLPPLVVLVLVVLVVSAAALSAVVVVLPPVCAACARAHGLRVPSCCRGELGRVDLLGTAWPCLADAELTGRADRGIY